MPTAPLSRSVSSRHWSRIFVRILNSLTLLSVIALVMGAAYEFVQERIDARRYPMPGELISVGDTALHIHCAGIGSPTVVFDAGLGDSSATWDLVLPGVSKFTRACAYDRAGYGWSQAPNEPRTTANIVSELGSLLLHAGISGPYVLVGHSFGGFNVRGFAAKHPDQVAGMVLVDSSHPDQLNRFPASGQPESVLSHYKFGAWMMLFGTPRIFGWCRNDYTFPNAPAAWKPVEPKVIALDCRHRVWQTLVAEEEEFRTNSQAVAGLGKLGNVPLVVLSHDPDVGAGFPPADAPAAEAAWTAMQEDLRALSPNSRRIVAKGSGHYIEVYRPELVIDSIREIVQASRGTERFERSVSTVER